MSKRRKPRVTRARPKKISTAAPKVFTEGERLGRDQRAESARLRSLEPYNGPPPYKRTDKRPVGNFTPRRDQQFGFASRGLGFYRLGARYRVTAVRRGLVYFRRQLGGKREGPPQSLPLPEWRDRVCLVKRRRGKMKQKPRSEAKRTGVESPLWAEDAAWEDERSLRRLYARIEREALEGSDLDALESDE